MAEEEGAPVETPTEPPPPAPEEAPTPPPAEPPPPAPEESPTPPSAEPPPPAPEEAPTPPPEEPPPAAPEEAAAAPAGGSPKPSKSTLVMEKRASAMSRVRLQEPGDVPPEGEKEIKPVDGEKRKSDSERKKSEGRSSQSGRGSVRTSLRGSTAGEGSKEGILRRKSDRPSKSRLAVGSVVSIRRTSGYGEYSAGGKVPKYMNSYKLDSDNPFQVERVEKILKDVLTEALEDLTYDVDKCPKQAKWASSAIRSRVKEQEFDRYRFVVLVTIGEKRYHDMCCMVRFLWDIERDKYAIFVHENMYVFATALCFGVYYE